MKEKKILIGHGSGGKLTHELIENIFLKHFSNKHLSKLTDSAVVEIEGKIAFTTDSYVIDPVFFPGGDIGKLAVSGTINDLLTCGAIPKYLSAGFIIEEGFDINDLDKIAESMAQEAKSSGVVISSGDTKVVKKGQCDKIFINTSGVGEVPGNLEHLSNLPKLEIGDKVIVSGYLGDHAIAILSARNNIQFERPVFSDVSPLTNLITPLLNHYGTQIKFMRDITRGGLATILNEVIGKTDYCIELNENKIPVRCETQGICEVFGYDPLYLANEGKMALVVSSDTAEIILKEMRNTVLGKNAEIVGEVTHEAKGRVILNSVIGGSRIVDMLTGEMLPRIC